MAKMVGLPVLSLLFMGCVIYGQTRLERVILKRECSIDGWKLDVVWKKTVDK